VSEIERYLDELFGQLAGTGAAGRRALAEAEYHLRTAAAGAMARGLPEDQAEHEAVSQFGSPALVAGTLRSAGRLSPAVSAAWLLAGLVACGAGAAYLAATWWHTWQTAACTIVLTYNCTTTSVLVTRITTAAVIIAVGAMLLLGRWFAVRYAALTPSRRGFALRPRR
jgi:hypothetical protein